MSLSLSLSFNTASLLSFSFANMIVLLLGLWLLGVPLSLPVICLSFFCSRSPIRIVRLRQMITYPEELTEPEVSAPDTTPDDLCCVICRDRFKATVMVPCGHVCTCVTCARNTRPVQCPVCQRALLMVVRKFD